MKPSPTRYFIAFIILIASMFGLSAQDKQVCIWDLSAINSEENPSRYLSVQRMADVAGVSYDVTSDFEEASQYPIIITASRVKQGVLHPLEINAIFNFVASGGIFISSAIQEPLLYPLFGITEVLSNNTKFEMRLEMDKDAQFFRLLDDPMEQVISLGKAADGNTFYTKCYGGDQFTSLSHYEDQTCAIIQNNYGLGAAYAWGPDFRDLVYRNHLNMDMMAHRSYSNGFEPSTDVTSLLFRNIVAMHLPQPIFKHTAPGPLQSVVMITHDIDSRTGIDSMYMFSEYEFQHGIRGHYNVTTRYVVDDWMSAFYLGSYSEIAQLITENHTIGSHSVGHFPDFADETAFPVGTFIPDPVDYNPAYQDGVTVGGTLYGEAGISKYLLENDFNYNIRSWRSGHLAYPDSLNFVLDDLGYDFNSSFSANDVLSSFPFKANTSNRFSGQESNVLEIPMTISDVFHDDPITAENYLEKVVIWNAVQQKYHANYAPTVLLIHPNRGFKLNAMDAFLGNLPKGTGLVNFEEYGDFWNNRFAVNFRTTETDSILNVYFETPIFEGFSMVKPQNGPEEVRFFDMNQNEVFMAFEILETGDRVYYLPSETTSLFENSSENQGKRFEIYPNPTSGVIHIRSTESQGACTFNLIDSSGRNMELKARFQNSNEIEIDLNQAQTPPGFYIVQICNNGRIENHPLIKN